MAVTNGWGKGAQNNTNGWGKSGTNNIGYGAIYESSAAGDTALIGTSAAFLYSKSSFNQGEADPTPTITGTAGGSFNASANVVFVDTGTFNSSTGQIDLSATSIGSHIITYTVNGVQSGQTVGVTAVPYASTSSFTFDGVDSYFSIDQSALSTITNNPFSVSMWFKKPTGAAQKYLGGASDSTSSSSVAFNFSVTNNIFWYGPQAGAVTSVGTYHDNNWHHVVFVAESATSSKIYVDGINDTNPANTNRNRIASSAIINPINIGASNTGSTPWNGNIDEVSFWNTALSSNAVTEIYNSGAPNDLTTLTNASNTNLKAWYKF